MSWLDPFLARLSARGFWRSSLHIPVKILDGAASAARLGLFDEPALRELREGLVERIPYFIEEVYNKKRLHSSIGYMPPEEYERLMMEKSTNMACKLSSNFGI